jgi:sugar-specific transcriptional regulator TrmB
MPPASPPRGPVDDREVSELVSLGLTIQEARAYAAVLERPRTPGEIARAAGLTSTVAQRVVRGLTHRGMLRRLPGRVTRYDALPPDWALTGLIHDLERALEHGKQASRELTRRFHLSRGPDLGPEYVEVVVGRDAVVAQLETEVAAAREEVLAFVKRPILTASNPGARRSLERSVPNRTVWERELFEDQQLASDARDWAALGEQIRVVPHLPSKLVIIDGRTAIINVSEAMEGLPVVAGFVTRHPELVATLQELFEVRWQRGVPVFDIDLAPEADASEQQLIEALAAGMKDSAIARQLGISERTLSRRINELLESLGVETRFQAGLLVGRGA